MRSAGTPQLDAAAVYRAVSAARREREVRARLARAEPDVLAAYGAYVAAAQDVTVLGPAQLATQTATDLRGNYASKSSVARDVKARIMQANVGGRCPLCGHGPAATLDHYLPCGTFPEFAVLPVNLVPACWPCNTRKGETYAANGTALYLHAYLDAVSATEQFLFADVDVDEREIVVSYRVDPATVPEHLRDRVVSHFERLQLARTFQGEAVAEIGERRLAMEQELARGGADALRDHLDQAARSVIDFRGVNHWRSALLLGMLASDAVLAGAFVRPSST